MSKAVNKLRVVLTAGKSKPVICGIEVLGPGRRLDSRPRCMPAWWRRRWVKRPRLSFPIPMPTVPGPHTFQGRPDGRERDARGPGSQHDVHAQGRRAGERPLHLGSSTTADKIRVRLRSTIKLLAPKRRTASK